MWFSKICRPVADKESCDYNVVKDCTTKRIVSSSTLSGSLLITIRGDARSMELAEIVQISGMNCF